MAQTSNAGCISSPFIDKYRLLLCSVLEVNVRFLLQLNYILHLRVRHTVLKEEQIWSPMPVDRSLFRCAQPRQGPSRGWCRGTWLHRKERAACQTSSRTWILPPSDHQFSSSPLGREPHLLWSRTLLWLLQWVPASLQIIFLISCLCMASGNTQQTFTCGFWSLLMWYKPAMLVAFSSPS